MAETTSSETMNVIIAVDQLLSKVTPDCMLVLAIRIAVFLYFSKKKKDTHIPFEAGNRCFDVGSESHRRIADHIADINITYSSIPEIT